VRKGSVKPASAPAKPATPSPPAQYTPSNPSARPLAYTRAGHLLKLGIVQSPGEVLNSRISLYIQQNIPAEIATQMPVITTGKELDAVLFSILQQSFQFIKEQLDRDKKKRKRKEQEAKKKAEEDSESEEKAMELLDMLFEHVDDVENVEAFCSWARESVEQTRAEMEKYHNNLPDQLEASFEIMDDALTALEHGVSPELIKMRLQEEINLKQSL